MSTTNVNCHSSINSTTINHLYNQLNEIKRFKNYCKQLNLLLDETLNACKDIKNLQSPLAEIIEEIKLKDEQIEYIRQLRKKRLCFVVCGQNVLAKSIVANELLARHLFPFKTENIDEERWRIVKVKHGKNPNCTYQLIDSDFELMNIKRLAKEEQLEQQHNKFLSRNGSLNSFGTSENSRSSTHSSMSISHFLVNYDDLRLNDYNIDDEYTDAENLAILEVTIDCKLLDNDVDLIVYSNTMPKYIYEHLSQNILPIYLYATIDDQLSESNVEELLEMKQLIGNNSIYFLKIPNIRNYNNDETLTNVDNNSNSLSSSDDTTSSEDLFKMRKQTNIDLLKYLHKQSTTTTTTHTTTTNGDASSSLSSTQENSTNLSLFKQLCELDYLNINPNGTNNETDESNVNSQQNDYFSSCSVSSLSGSENHKVNNVKLAKIENEYCEKWNHFHPTFGCYLKRLFRTICINATTILFKTHENYLHNFINFAFDMARDMLITPRKLEYAREKEQILFDSLNSLASLKQEELKQLINNTIQQNRDAILDAARQYQFIDIEFQEASSSSSSGGSYYTVKYAKDFKKCTQQIQELVITKLNNAIGQQISDSVEVLKENYVGTLKRCLQSLEDMNNLTLSMDSSSPSSSNSHTNLVRMGSTSSTDSTNSASEALKQILNSAYQVEVAVSGNSSSIVRVLIERMKELLRNMPWGTTPKLDAEWKVSIASNILNSLSESKLARVLCSQMRERLKTSHHLFTTSLKLLETKHSGRLEKTEENQQLLRKTLAPKFAKLCLESVSLRDLIMHGMPQLGKEIGRGQYGVVYQCAKWGPYTHLAIKSVVPPDDKHWNDLALEFHYTKQITDHERIVKLIGSVIDYSYAGGLSPAVLLIMEGMKRDLYTALKVGLDWIARLQISLDVVEGIRYLHGRGLVHRDIKLKNVLLDSSNRAKITDLGFCKPEAMMSGSIVGTPVHMAPEVFNSRYDNSVDIYAFGILFWYICAGHIRLPHNFEQCTSKDDLWSAVKRGKRPERLSTFDDDCWKLMERCWNHEAKERPHIGEVYTFLNKIFLKYKS